MIINIRVDHTLADIETMEKVSKDLKKLFSTLKEQIDIKEYIEINTCNRYEYFLYTDDYNELDLDCENKYVIIQYSDEAVLHLFRMTSGLESLIIGEDQILGQVKDSKRKSEKEGHCGKKLDAVFTKAIHVGQVVRNKTKINQGSISIGSAAVDLAEENLGDLQDKNVLVIGAGKMGTLVAKALAEKNLKAIFVANRTYYKAIKLAEELDGEAILFDNLEEKLLNADLVISSTGAPHAIINKARLLKVFDEKIPKKIVFIDIANPRDIEEDVKEIGIDLFNIDDLRGIAEKNKKLREKEVIEAEKIIKNEFDLLKESFNLIEINSLLGSLRESMEEIRQRESQKGIVKLNSIDAKDIKTIDKMTQSIVNKIFYDISENIRKTAKNNEEDYIRICEMILKGD
ncbi:MAG: glutamyl-tRNA reductase [Methanobrevibacter ruminantium]|uniref:glutamyl-tRNA reductase n=1 Tax=Methanobrevibacter ruminantium TaxID=83816 RepID=UPI0026EB8224|nr:glutamyl-tRNA reductase [Methanobrevibacter ruminantium]MCI5737493.1 glutamyl-tRNA reductase [Methanobrevibacter ruminantium]MDO5842216.1 glutamyl-tRNA reductase [Methanobrevibacter ruminantium]